MDFFTLAKNRYSVRKFSERSVEPEKLEKVLEAARVAPTAHNYQPFRIYVLKSKDAIAKIRELTPCAFNAPIVLMVTICRDESSGSMNWKKGSFPGRLMQESLEPI